MRKDTLAFIVILVLSTSLAVAMDITPRADGTDGPEAPAQLDLTTHKTFCSQSEGISVQLPGQSSATEWPACSTVETVATDYCQSSPTGVAIPCTDSGGKIPSGMLPIEGTTNYLPKKTASGWGDSRVVDDGGSTFGFNAGSNRTVYFNGDQLSINGIASPGLKIFSSGADGWLIYNGAQIAGNLSMYDIDASADRFVLKSDGTVQMGGTYFSPTITVSTSANSLTVNGDLIAKVLKLNGATSGTVTVTVPSAAGTTTFPLPGISPTSGQYFKATSGTASTWGSITSGDVTGGLGFTPLSASCSTTNALVRRDGSCSAVVDNGNIGIGATSPGTKLSLGANAAGKNSAATQISVFDGGTSSYGMGLINDGTTYGLGLYAANTYAGAPVVSIMDSAGGHATKFLGPLKLNGSTSGTVTHGVAATTASYSLLDPSTAPGAGQAIVYPSGGGQGTWVTPIAANASIAPATKTKITYDAKGLVTAGADATAADVGAVAGAGTMTGTTNYLAKKTATGWGDSQVYDNGTNIGIGSTAAYTKLSLGSNTAGVNSAATQMSVWNSGTVSYGMGLINDGTTYGLGLYAANTYAGTPVVSIMDSAGGHATKFLGPLKLNGSTSGTVTHGVASTTASYVLTDPSTAPSSAGQAIVYPSGGGQGTWTTPLAADGATGTGCTSVNTSAGKVTSCSTTAHLVANAVTDNNCTKVNFVGGQATGCNYINASDVTTALGFTPGQGTHTGSMTSGKVPKANGTTSLTDSLMSDNGSTVTVAGGLSASSVVSTSNITSSAGYVSGTNIDYAGNTTGTSAGNVPKTEWRIKQAYLGRATTDISVSLGSSWTLAVASDSFSTGAYDTDVYATTVFSGECSFSGSWVTVCMSVNVDSTSMLGGQACTTVSVNGGSFSLTTTARSTPGSGAHNVNGYVKITNYSATSATCTIVASTPLSTFENATTQVFLRQQN